VPSLHLPPGKSEHFADLCVSHERAGAPAEAAVAEDDDALLNVVRKAAFASNKAGSAGRTAEALEVHCAGPEKLNY
jgi:hypothetical protein